MTKEEKDLHNCLQEWINNPLHWKNNKRKYKGLHTLRKPLNKKERFRLPLIFYHLLNAYLEQEMKTKAEEMINCCTDIRNIKLGDKECHFH